MSDLAVGLSLFAFLMLSYWLVRVLGGDARGDYRTGTRHIDHAQHAEHGQTVSGASAEPARAEAAITPTQVGTPTQAGTTTEEEASVVVVPKSAPPSLAPVSSPVSGTPIREHHYHEAAATEKISAAAPSVDSAIVDIDLPPQKPLAATTPVEAAPPISNTPAAATASVEISKPAAPYVAKPAAPEPVRVEVIRDAPAPQAVAKAAEPASATAATVAAAAATVVASVVAKAAAPAPAAETTPDALRADARGTLPPGYRAPDAIAPAKRFDDAAVFALPAGYQRASSKTTIAPPVAPVAAVTVQQTKFEPLPPLKPITVSPPPPSTGPSPIVPADWRNTVSATYQRPILADAPRAFSSDPVVLPAHYARAHWMSTLSPEVRAALPPKSAPAVAPVVPAAAPAAVAPAAVAPVTAAPVPEKTTPAASAASSSTAGTGSPSPMPASWYASKGATATAATAAVTAAVASVSNTAAAAVPAATPAPSTHDAKTAPKAEVESPYTARANTLPRSDATAVAPKASAPAAPAPVAVAAAPAAMASPSAASVLVSTARRGTRVVGADADGDDAIDLLAANPPRPQTPSIWDTTTPRRSVSDDAVFAAEVVPAGAVQSIKGERIPVRAETLLVRPDVSRTLSPPAAPAVAAVTAPPPRPALPAANYSEIGPIPTDRPLVSTASGTAGGHAISQARMGVEPAKPVVIAKPNVSATLPPGALGDD